LINIGPEPGAMRLELAHDRWWIIAAAGAAVAA
jgi:hypothetical protein